MLKSMTAYADHELSTDEVFISVEMKTVNSRHLDVQLRINHEYRGLEDKIKAQIAASVVRGRIDVKIQIRETSEAELIFEVDEAKANALNLAWRSLQNLLGQEGPLPLELIASRNDIIIPQKAVSDLDKVWEHLNGCIQTVLGAVAEMRKHEGDYIAKDFQERLHFLSASIGQIESASANLSNEYKQRLMERIAVLTEDTFSLDEGRLEQEVAYLADKSDISEEVLRVRSHLEQFKSIMADDGPAGHKLNFLLQEINREFNTIGSKAGKTEIAHLVVDVKSELEKIREQVQNIE
jgi:uncharacterized protein (TIGR00255 family)